MTTYAERYDAALLAHDAYVDFDSLKMAGHVVDGPDLIGTLVASGRFTAEQAQYFESRFTAVAFRNVVADGFQAAVFRDRDSNRLTLALRGSEETSDWINNVMVGVTGKAWT